jgi:hypothetical protein
MTNQATSKEILELTKSLLADDKFINALARRISLELGEIARTPPDIGQCWQDQLDLHDIHIAKDCTAERLTELFPLTPDEIKRVGIRIRTGDVRGELSLETVREHILAQLGDDTLMTRAGHAEQVRPESYKRCGNDYQCGQPYYCGHEVNCGTPYELLPCGVIYDYACRPLKDCPTQYYKKRG